MVSENKVFLIGNLTKDPELRYTPGGQAVAVFTVAINRKYKNTTGEMIEKTDFIPIEVWRKQAESCKQYLTKGSCVYIEGRLQTNSWEADDGTKRSKLKVVAQRVQFLTKPSGWRNEQDKTPHVDSEIGSGLGEGEGNEGDIPF